MSANKPPSNVFFALLNLARLRITFMELIACAIGYVLAYRGEFNVPTFLWTLLGTGLLSAGACTLNCFIERKQDALMPRTANRPIPAGVISPAGALVYGVTLIVSGALLLYFYVNLLCSVLGIIAAVTYLGVYTPAKRLTWWNTSIGAIPGAIPPLMGWAAARSQIDPGGWILFAMLFIWQHTHFLPIAWLYKNDYAAGGFQMLPVLEITGQKTFQLTVATAIILLPISMLLCGTSLTGYAYCLGAAVFGVLLIIAGVRLSKHPSKAGAHAVLYLSLWYLPVILAAVCLDRYGADFGTHLHAWLETNWRWT